MTEEKKTPRAVPLRAKYRVVDQEPPAVVHVVNFHRLGTEVLMTMGRLDIMEVATRFQALQAEGKEPSEDTELEVEVFDRFAMSPDAFARLVANAKVIEEAMIKSGQLESIPQEKDEDEDARSSNERRRG